LSYIPFPTHNIPDNYPLKNNDMEYFNGFFYNRMEGYLIINEIVTIKYYQYLISLNF